MLSNNSRSGQVTAPSQIGRAGGESSARRRLSYKEKRELEALETTIANLEAEKADLESALCSGTLSVSELTEKSKRLPLLQDELDAAEMRWLELSEIGT